MGGVNIKHLLIIYAMKFMLFNFNQNTTFNVTGSFNPCY
jgi:hypothetical protein